MSENQSKDRVCKTTGEIEVQGTSSEVKEWWEKLWPEISGVTQGITPVAQSRVPRGNDEALPEIFGEHFTRFRSDITDVDRMLIAGQFAAEKDAERVFTTKVANQLLLDQHIKIGNPSECVRRLVASKRVFVASGKFRVSSTGLEYLNSLKD